MHNDALKFVPRALDSIVDFLAGFGPGRDFIRFGMVGAFGFLFDTATVYSVRGFAGIYVAGICAFFVAATATWVCNRIWTFRHLPHMAAHHQLVRFLLTNAIGFVFNRGAFFVLVTVSPLCRSQPVLAIMAGGAAGLYFNYFLSKRFVFR